MRFNLSKPNWCSFVLLGSPLQELLLARGPSESHCSELFMVSTGARFRLSGDIFIYHLKRPSSSPLLLSRMLSTAAVAGAKGREGGRGGRNSPPALLLAPGEPVPRWRQTPAAPAALNGPSSLSAPYSKTARHGAARGGSGITLGIEKYLETKVWAETGLNNSFVFLRGFFCTQARTGGVRPPRCGCMCVRLDHDDAKCGGSTDRESCKEFTGDSRCTTAA